MINNFYLEALFTIHPNTQYTEGSGASKTIAKDIDNNVIELDETKIQTEIDRLEAEYTAQAYSRARKAKYDALNQLELISDDAINDTTTHKDAIVAIKTAHPKPE